MTRDWFSLILHIFHINNNENYVKKGEPGYDLLFKIRPLQDPLLTNFKAAYNPSRELSKTK